MAAVAITWSPDEAIRGMAGTARGGRMGAGQGKTGRRMIERPSPRYRPGGVAKDAIRADARGSVRGCDGRLVVLAVTRVTFS